NMPLAAPGGINNSGQVVGFACDPASNACLAYISEGGVLADLNDLIPADSPLYLASAYGINDAGEIVGQAMDKNTGEMHAYLASPVHGAADIKTSAAKTGRITSSSSLPGNVRKLSGLRLGHPGR